MQQLITKLTKVSSEKERQLLRAFSRFPPENKLEVFDTQRPIFHQLKQKHKDIANNILTYCSLILSIDQFVKSDKKFDIKALAIKHKNQRKARKREKILDRWAIVKTLKIDQNMSFRAISIYLKKHHKIEVAHSTIFDMWNELESNK